MTVPGEPGIPASPTARMAECHEEVCVTCSDTAVAVRVIELLPGELALVATGDGPAEEVSVALVDAAPGDTVLVHAGEAIALVERADRSAS